LLVRECEGGCVFFESCADTVCCAVCCAQHSEKDAEKFVMPEACEHRQKRRLSAARGCPKKTFPCIHPPPLHRIFERAEGAEIGAASHFLDCSTNYEFALVESTDSPQTHHQYLCNPRILDCKTHFSGFPQIFNQKVVIILRVKGH
jgi:hypothetical protein